MEKCICDQSHKSCLEDVEKKVISETEAYRLSEFFKAFSDTTRIRIMNALFISEMCVCDLSALLSMSQSATSHQLKVLRQSRLVKPRREGKTVYYSLDDSHIEDIIQEGLIHIREEGKITHE